ncbi:hypothetical protein CDIK_1136 [Cucumispora dikerogammari]|nr:hypothetical protein CDIK_1136 [Cucumispora dikerogammari]
MNATIVHEAPYSPQTQRQIERLNRTLKSRIRKYLSLGNKNRLVALKEIVYQYNTSNHKATKLPPFVLFKNLIQKRQIGQLPITFLKFKTLKTDIQYTLNSKETSII